MTPPQGSPGGPRGRVAAAPVVAALPITALALRRGESGDEVPGIIVASFTGDPGDIAAQIGWKDGTWTMVISRKLSTGSEFGVQFSDPRKEYAFGIAVDNAPARHAFTPGVLKMVFE